MLLDIRIVRYLDWNQDKNTFFFLQCIFNQGCVKSVAYPNNVFLLLSLGKPSDDPLSPDYITSKLQHRADPSRKMDRYQRSPRRASEVYEMSTTVQPTE